MTKAMPLQNTHINIAVIMTCFNRKVKTIHCIENLFAAEKSHNAICSTERNINIAIYLTNDSCTDGTADAVRKVCKEHELHIIQGDGHCYWAGGMRMAWGEALKEKERWAFYLLVNDDTFVYENCFTELFKAHKYCHETYGKGGIYSGITCDTTDRNRITYGGYVWVSRFWGTDKILLPTGTPQPCDKTNCNITMVDKTVVENIGIFFEGYTHSLADYDYSMQAKKYGFPTVVTGRTCGECEYDHRSEVEQKERLLSMTLNERKAFFHNPLHLMVDTLLFMKRNTPARYPLFWAGRMLNLYIPQLYYLLSDIRNTLSHS